MFSARKIEMEMHTIIGDLVKVQSKTVSNLIVGTGVLLFYFILWQKQIIYASLLNTESREV